jgi:hypothetical protein
MYVTITSCFDLEYNFHIRTFIHFLHYLMKTKVKQLVNVEKTQYLFIVYIEEIVE